jgi:hypothetical protein
MSQVAADTLTLQGNELLQREQFTDACACFERATAIFPTHELAWKGLGQALYNLGRFTDAARAFDKAIGFKPKSATALWGGALAHAELGNRVVAQNYLLRTLELQPTWIEMVKTTPQLASYVLLSTYIREVVRNTIGPFAAKKYRHASDRKRSIEVERVLSVPTERHTTYVSIGLCDHTWHEPSRPQLEFGLTTLNDSIAADACGQILVNAVFHCIDNQFAPTPSSIIRGLIGVLGLLDVSLRFPHAYFVEPKILPAGAALDAGPPVVRLLQLIPLTDLEYQFWRDNGAAAFDMLLQAKAVDVTNLRRTCAIGGRASTEP